MSDRVEALDAVHQSTIPQNEIFEISVALSEETGTVVRMRRTLLREVHV
jgi:hypothetical protein